MKILIFIPFPPNATGGVEHVAEHLADDLSSRGHIVHHVFRGGNELQRIERDQGTAWIMPFEHLHTWKKIPRLGSLKRMSRTTVRLHRLLKQTQPDIVNCHFANFSSLYFLALRSLHEYRLVISTHGSDVLAPASPVHRIQLPFLLRGACHVTAVSRPLLKSAQGIAQIGHHSSVIHNGIDYEFWSEGSTSTQHSSPSDPPVIINVGSLRLVKGQDILLDAFANISESFPRARLRLVGKGKKQNDLSEQAKSLGIRDRVDFHGWCSSEEVRRLLRKSTVFAFPSRSEGFGLALLEAMAVGLPVVASNVGGIPDILKSSDQGMKVSPDSVSALACALRELLGSSSKRQKLGGAASRRAADFRWSKTVGEYQKLFSFLLKPEMR